MRSKNLSAFLSKKNLLIHDFFLHVIYIYFTYYNKKFGFEK